MRKIAILLIIAILTLSIIPVKGAQWTRIEEGDYWVYVPSEDQNSEFYFNVTDTTISDLIFYNWIETNCDPLYLIPLNRTFRAESNNVSQEVTVAFSNVEIAYTESSDGIIQCTSVANVPVYVEAQATMDLEIVGDFYNYTLNEEGIISFSRVSGNLFQTIATAGAYEDQIQFIFSTADYFLELTFNILCYAKNSYDLDVGGKIVEVNDIVCEEKEWYLMDGLLTRGSDGTIISNDPWFFGISYNDHMGTTGHSPNPSNPDSEIFFDVTHTEGDIYTNKLQFSGDVGLPLNVTWEKEKLIWSAGDPNNMTIKNKLSESSIIQKHNSYSMELIEATIQNWGYYQSEKNVTLTSTSSSTSSAHGFVGISLIVTLSIVVVKRRNQRKKNIT